MLVRIGPGFFDTSRSGESSSSLSLEGLRGKIFLIRKQNDLTSGKGLSKIDDFVRSRNQTAKKKDLDARRANPEE